MNYIPYFVPSSNTPIPSNVFLGMNHPNTSSGPLGGYGPLGMVPSLSGVPVFEGYGPPQVTAIHPIHQMGNIGNIIHPS